MFMRIKPAFYRLQAKNARNLLMFFTGHTAFAVFLDCVVAVDYRPLWRKGIFHLKKLINFTRLNGLISNLQHKWRLFFNV